jgi:hypothetical protein
MSFVVGLFTLAAGVWLLGCAFECSPKEPFWKAFFYALAFANAITYIHLTGAFK